MSPAKAYGHTAMLSQLYGHLRKEKEEEQLRKRLFPGALSTLKMVDKMGFEPTPSS